MTVIWLKSPENSIDVLREWNDCDPGQWDGQALYDHLALPASVELLDRPPRWWIQNNPPGPALSAWLTQELGNSFQGLQFDVGTFPIEEWTHPDNGNLVRPFIVRIGRFWLVLFFGFLNIQVTLPDPIIIAVGSNEPDAELSADDVSAVIIDRLMIAANV